MSAFWVGFAVVSVWVAVLATLQIDPLEASINVFLFFVGGALAILMAYGICTVIGGLALALWGAI